MSVSSEGENEDLVNLHTAKIVIDNFCRIYKPEVVDILKSGHIVRISFTVESEMFWTHDAPYVKILSINKDYILGEIADIHRQVSNMYPLNIGDRIMFNKDNIIEIPRTLQDDEKNSRVFTKFLTDQTVQCTGPLFTVESDEESSSSDDNNCDVDSIISDSD